MKRNFLIVLSTIIFTSNVLSQESRLNLEEYAQLGYVVRSFSDADLKNYIGALSGIEGQAGVKLSRLVDAELSGAWHWKKLNDDEKFKYWDLSFIVDFCPGSFYVGGGLTFAGLIAEYYDTSKPGFPEWVSYSENGIGFTARIGYEIRIVDGLNLYSEVKYTSVTLEDIDAEVDVASYGFSVGLRLY